jgi:hypothetical protein
MSVHKSNSELQSHSSSEKICVLIKIRKCEQVWIGKASQFSALV